jgi:hypothetical protein
MPDDHNSKHDWNQKLQQAVKDCLRIHIENRSLRQTRDVFRGAENEPARVVKRDTTTTGPIKKPIWGGE